VTALQKKHEKKKVGRLNNLPIYVCIHVPHNIVPETDSIKGKHDNISKKIE
jgi:hypothetical protein